MFIPLQQLEQVLKVTQNSSSLVINPRFCYKQKACCMNTLGSLAQLQCLLSGRSILISSVKLVTT